MGLRDFNTAMQLNIHLQRYLNSAVDYNILRGNVLANLPIQGVVSEIYLELDTMASVDKNKARNDLTAQAHQDQADADIQQAAIDAMAKSRHITTIEQQARLLAQIDIEQRGNIATLALQEVALSSELAMLHRIRNESSLLKAQIQRDVDHTIHHPSEIHQAPSHLPPSHQPMRATIHHPSLHHPAPHQHTHHVESLNQRLAAEIAKERQVELSVAGIRSAIRGYESKKSRLQQQRADCESTLQTTRDAQQDIETRAIEREQRRQVRERSPGDLAALSLSSRQALEARIRAAHEATDMRCRELKQDVSEQCYDAFLNQLEIYLGGLSTLQHSEKIALKQMIVQMKHYLRELSNLQHQTTLLRNLEGGLQALRDELSSSASSASSLLETNRVLETNNTRLTAEIETLSQQKSELVSQRNQYALYTLVGSVLSSLGAVAVYFLIQASIIAMPPLALPIMAGLTGAALTSSLLISCIAGIRGFFRQSEINTKTDLIEENNRRISQNTTTAGSLQQRGPRLQEGIAAKELQIVTQRGITQGSEQRKNDLLRAAHEISVDVGADSSARSGPRFSQVQSQTLFGAAGDVPPAYTESAAGNTATFGKVS